MAAIDVAIVGDDEEAAMIDRPDFALLGKGNRIERLRAGVRFTVGVYERSVPVLKALQAPAASDEAARARLTQYDNDRRNVMAAGLKLILGTPAPEEIVDAIWALASPEVFTYLTQGRGWSTATTEAWLVDMSSAAISKPTANTRARGTPRVSSPHTRIPAPATPRSPEPGHRTTRRNKARGPIKAPRSMREASARVSILPKPYLPICTRTASRLALQHASAPEVASCGEGGFRSPGISPGGIGWGERECEVERRVRFCRRRRRRSRNRLLGLHVDRSTPRGVTRGRDAP
jgi:hypothetical protein